MVGNRTSTAGVALLVSVLLAGCTGEAETAKTTSELIPIAGGLSYEARLSIADEIAAASVSARAEKVRRSIPGLREDLVRAVSVRRAHSNLFQSERVWLDARLTYDGRDELAAGKAFDAVVAQLKSEVLEAFNAR